VTGRLDKASDGVEAGGCLSFLRGKFLSGGKDWQSGDWKRERISLYMAYALAALSVATLFANKGSLWFWANKSKRYEDEISNIPPEIPEKLRGVTRGDVLHTFRIARDSLE